MLKNRFYLIICLSFLLCHFVFHYSYAEDKLFFGNGPSGKKAVSLTFDDGPGFSTEKMLQILEKYDVKATFFMLGSQVEKKPDVARKVLAAGHEIGSHGYAHPNFYKYKKEDKEEVLKKDLEKAEYVFNKALNIKLSLLRMPYGFTDRWVREIAEEMNYKLISWTFGCDWKKMSKDELTAEYLKNLRPGAIFLLHDGGGKRELTASALPGIIEGIRGKGYSIITVGEMLDFND